MPRKRELMRVFKDIGLVEQLGFGMSRILSAYERDIFEISEHFIKVVFPLKEMEEENKISPKANGNECGDENGDVKIILLLLKQEPDITAKKLSMKTGFSTRKISRIIKELREKGRISRAGSARKGYWIIH